ncbi:SDR family NAD(P)-dependent oxidoreductase [Candidatus Gracilibacteria bacterium]|nr:SDR family NAD(P)-dependent oxidoreductase [Candidatus Gracilibacteria bacterium]
MSKSIAMISGASSGIGKATAQLLAQHGYQVYAGVRRREAMALVRGQNIEPVLLDVSSDESVVAAVGHVITQAGRIDALVNNAGYGQYGVLEDVDLADAQRQFDSNVFGLIRLTKAVLPTMRQQRSGRIINISSVAGRVATPMAGWYSASKHAVEALSDALRLEMQAFNVQVIVIQPGAIKTGFDSIAVQELERTTRTAAYRPMITAFSRLITNSYQRAPGPEIVAAAIVRACVANKPPARITLPSHSHLLIGLKQLLGDGLFDRLLRSQLRPGASAETTEFQHGARRTENGEPRTREPGNREPRAQSLRTSAVPNDVFDHRT